MRTLKKISLSGVALLGVVVPATVLADDTNPNPPDVLLILDNSGAMQWAVDKSDVPNCGANVSPNASAELSRWAIVVQGLTGTIHGFGCSSSNSPFVSGAIFSNQCQPGANPDATFTNLYDWPLAHTTVPAYAQDPVNFQHYNAAGTTFDGTYCKPAVGGWDQAADGVLDTFGDQIRFGLMTVDDQYRREDDNATHSNVTWGPTDATITPRGGYSYWWTDATHNWTNGSGAHTGRYAFDASFPTSPHTWEVGGRNPNAPPWAGRLMGFGKYDDPKHIIAQNDRVQLAILAAGTANPTNNFPFVTAPLEGLMSDADDLMVRDTTVLANYPVNGESFYVGPASDPANTCRDKSIILVSSGAANFDMRDPGDGFIDPSWGCNSPLACLGHWGCHTHCDHGQTCTGSWCDPGAHCDFHVDHGSTENSMVCGLGSDCNLHVDHSSTAQHIACVGSADCDLNCDHGSTCREDCTLGAHCDHTDCHHGSQCLLNCFGAASCSFHHCDGTETDCGGGIHVCNRACPTCGDGFCDPGEALLCPADCPFNSANGCEACDRSDLDSNAKCPYNAAGAGYYANDLKANHGISTYVIGMGQTTLRYQKNNATCNHGWSENPAGTCNADCNDVDASDFAPGEICDGTSGKWEHRADGAGFDDPSACCELKDVATKGGTTAPYYPKSATDMKDDIANILTKIAKGSTTRTMPEFAVRAPGMVVANNPQHSLGVGPIGYEVLSSFEPFVGDTIWSGHLERRRLTCDGTGTTPIAEDIDTAKGDSLETVLIKNKATRNIFTVVAKNGTNPDLSRTMRRNDLAVEPTAHAVAMDLGSTDPLGARDDLTSVNQTAMAPAATLYTSINGPLGGTPATEDLLGINWASASANCNSLLGAGSAASCATKVLKWYGGEANGLSSDRLPGANCPSGAKCSPLGAIFHSQPVVSTPPSEYVRDEAYRNKFAVDQRNRPTVVYSSTLDGQLHAYEIENNDGPSQADYVTTPHTDADTNNTELWTFIPPAVLPSIWPNFNANANILDGGLALADIVPFRTASDAEQGLGDWATILVGSSGTSAEGGFYYALDVTNPIKPKFLWQIRTDGTGNPLFGKSVPTAAIATLGVKDKTNPTETAQVAVAILAGGTSTADPPSGTTARRWGCGGACAPSDATHARSNIRDWGSSEVARSVTVVELTTGRVIKRFVGMSGAGGDPPDLGASYTLRGAFDSPMSGTPIVFPNTPGVAASRAYIGDADGTLWRLDLSDRDPDNWKVSIAYDPYKTDYVTVGGIAPEVAGQPIQIPPIVSTDETERPVVMFATGDQNGFGDYKLNMRNYVISMVDTPIGSGKFQSNEAVGIELKDGERATGPLALFNESLYFASYNPNSANNCNPGEPRVWGVNYLHDTTGPKPQGSGAGDVANGLDTDGDGVLDARFATLTGSTGVIFGVGINRLPSCTTDAATTFNDGWLSGSYGYQSVPSGQYQLVVETGKDAAAGSQLGNDDLLSGQQGAQTNSLHVNLPQPKRTIRVDSWTSITE